MKTQKLELSVSQEKLHAACEARIAKSLGGIEKGYLSIVKDVATINQLGSYKAYDYKSMKDYVKDKFNMGKSTLFNLLTISRRFCDDKFTILPNYEGLGINQLLVLSVVDKEQEKLLPDNWKELKVADLKEKVERICNIEDKTHKEEKADVDKEETGKKENTFQIEYAEEGSVRTMLANLLDMIYEECESIDGVKIVFHRV